MFNRLKSTNFAINLTSMTDKHIQNILIENKIKLTLNLFDSNPGDSIKPVVVFLHGNSTSKKIFDTQLKFFLNNYRAITIDLLGHGESTKISTLDISNDDKMKLSECFYNPLAMMAEVVELLQSRQVTNAHFIGWSLGGHIAYGIATSNPELVASITTIGSPPVKFSYDGLKDGFSEWFVNVLVPEWINQPRHYSLEEAREMGKHIGINEKNLATFANDMAHSDPQMRRHLFLKLQEYNAKTFSASPLDGEHFLNTTNIPLCLIVGEKDAGINALHIANASKNMRHKLSSIHVIKNAPHAVFETHEDEYIQIIDEFIKKIMLSFHLTCT